jgi:hypothetical protein
MYYLVTLPEYESNPIPDLQAFPFMKYASRRRAADIKPVFTKK